MTITDPPRCPWCGTDPLYVAYHDQEWGVPCHDDRKLFEFLLLEGAQAGLSWITILRKREAYRRAFHDFDPERIARYDDSDVKRLMGDAGIVRNRLKILAAINNARCFLETRSAFGSFDGYLWRFVDGKPLRNRWQTMDEVPAETDLSRALSRDLLARGYKFVGPTIMYAFMQAVGLVDDHLASCHRRNTRPNDRKHDA